MCGDEVTSLANTPREPTWFYVPSDATALHRRDPRRQARHPPDEYRSALCASRLVRPDCSPLGLATGGVLALPNVIDRVIFPASPPTH